MTYIEFLNDEKYKGDRQKFEQKIKNVYFSQKGYFLRKNMEVTDFTNEVYIRLIKFWNFDKFNYSLQTYLQIIIKHTMGTLYRDMDTEKRRINYDNEVLRLDNEEEQTEIIYNENRFNEQKCIDYVLSEIKLQTDREILKLYLTGWQIKAIHERYNVTREYVKWRIKKYKPLMQKKFIEYKNNL